MTPILRLASRLPYFRQFRARLVRLTEERDRLMRQCDLLESERNELAAHCERLDLEGKELAAHCERLNLERNELAAHCERLNLEGSELAAHCQKLSRELEILARQSTTPQEYLRQIMREDWDERARTDASYYTNTANLCWNDEEYFATGEANVCEHIRNDMVNICQGADPSRMRVLEIGSGAGRMTRALARIFGEVHAVDISAEMIRIAKQKLSDVPNAFFYQNNGIDLQVIPNQPLDFAFSYIVLQHIPRVEVIESYVRETYRLLKPGRLFKFQVQGSRPTERRSWDTWRGADFSVEDMHQMASRCGFEMRYWHGAGTQYFWLWFFKKT